MTSSASKNDTKFGTNISNFEPDSSKEAQQKQPPVRSLSNPADGFFSQIIESTEPRAENTPPEIVLAAEASLKLLSISPNRVTLQHPTVKVIDEIFETAMPTCLKIDPETKWQDLLVHVDRYSQAFKVLASSQTFLFNLVDDLDECIGQHAANVPFAVLLSNRTEAIAIIVQSLTRFVVFNPRRQNQALGPHFIVCSGIPSVLVAVQLVWPKPQIAIENASFHDLAMDMVAYSVVERSRTALEELSKLEQIEVLRIKLSWASGPAVEFQCSKCNRKFEVESIFTVATCPHVMCRRCAHEYFTREIASLAYPIVCPIDDCHQAIERDDLELIMSDEELLLYNHAKRTGHLNFAPFGKLPIEAKTSVEFNCPLCHASSDRQVLKCELSNCKHAFCLPCTSKHLLDYFTLRCPWFPDCKAEIKMGEAAMVIGFEQVGFCAVNGDYPGHQTAYPGASTNGAQVEDESTFKCLRCNQYSLLEEIFITNSKCLHQVCRTCAGEYCRAELEQIRSLDSAEIKCPSVDCKSRIELEAVSTVVDLASLKIAAELPKFNCPLCLDDKIIDDIFVLERCQHEMCRGCARDNILAMIDSASSLRCPYSSCSAEWTLEDAQLVGLSEDHFQRLERLLMEKATLGFTRCPKVDCNGLAEVVAPRTRFSCPVKTCGYNMCISCRRDWHTGTCDEYTAWLVENQQADARFDELISAKKLQACPVGREVVEKSEGCNHMQCRCGTHFCYLCGKQFQTNGWEQHDSLKEPGKQCLLFQYQFND